MNGEKADSPRRRSSLTGVALPDELYKPDMELLHRFQHFSSELLRLCILGVAAIGFLAANIALRQDSPLKALVKPSLPGYMLLIALAAFVIGGGFALLHSIFSSKSIFYHICALRRQEINDPTLDDEEKRNREFKRSSVCLWLSAIGLFVGVCLIAASMISAILK